MIINIVVDPEYNHPNIDMKKFTVDFDPNDTVDNLKTIISLKFTDLDPTHFELVQHGKTLNNNLRLIKANAELDGEFRMVEVERSCCMIY